MSLYFYEVKGTDLSGDVTMQLDFMFFLNSILFGLGLAMDAFSVSLADGLAEPHMKRRKMLLIAATFALFQGMMPLIGWGFVHTVLRWFSWLERLIPWISLVLLSYIGGKMVWEALHDTCEGDACELRSLGITALMIQAIATSIDALSVGFTIADYDFLPAFLCTAIIAAVTFGVCALGVFLGRQFGTRFSHKAEILGGCILILIGIEIFLTGIF